MSETADSPILFDDSLATVDESVEVAVENVTDEIETIEIDDSAAVDSSNITTKKTKSSSKSNNIPTVLPLSKVKKICKLDPAVNLVTADAVKLITFCTERFIEILAKSCVSCAKEQGRKTVSNADFQRAIRRSWLFYMLDEAIDEWPENSSNNKPTSRSKSAASNRSNDADEGQDDIPLGEEEEEDIADTEDIIQDDEIIELDITEIAEEEAEEALSPLAEKAEEEEEMPMEEAATEEQEAGIFIEEESSEDEEEESDIENQEEDTTVNDEDEIYVKDIEDF